MVELNCSHRDVQHKWPAHIPGSPTWYVHFYYIYGDHQCVCFSLFGQGQPPRRNPTPTCLSQCDALSLRLGRLQVSRALTLVHTNYYATYSGLEIHLWSTGTSPATLSRVCGVQNLLSVFHMWLFVHGFRAYAVPVCTSLNHHTQTRFSAFQPPVQAVKHKIRDCSPSLTPIVSSVRIRILVCAYNGFALFPPPRAYTCLPGRCRHTSTLFLLLYIVRSISPVDASFTSFRYRFESCSTPWKPPVV